MADKLAGEDMIYLYQKAKVERRGMVQVEQYANLLQVEQVLKSVSVRSM